MEWEEEGEWGEVEAVVEVGEEEEAVVEEEEED